MEDLKKCATEKTEAARTPDTAAGSREYEAPVLQRLGNLEQLQAYGCCYHDGSRYKN